MEGLKNKKVPKNTDALLVCKILNNLAPVELKFKWKKNGQTIEIDGEKYEFLVDGEKYQLKIKNFDKKDEGQYEIYLTEPDDYDISSSAKIELETSIGIFRNFNRFFLYSFLYTFH